MLQVDNTNMNMSGSSIANETTLATFNGNYGGNNDMHLYINVGDYRVALENKDALSSDIIAFLEALLANVVDLND